MKPVFWLLLLLLSCGFFACTKESNPNQTEISPTPERKGLDAAVFAELTSEMVEFYLFDEDHFQELEDYGVMDLRIFFDQESGDLDADFLFDASYISTTEFEKMMEDAPDRNWEASITLQFDEAEAQRLDEWLNRHFTGSTFLDLRILILENGTITVRGLRPTEQDLVDFPPQPLF